MSAGYNETQHLTEAIQEEGPTVALDKGLSLNFEMDAVNKVAPYD